MPAYPEELGEPDRLYASREDRPGLIIYVWHEPGQPEQIRLTLYEIHAEDYGYFKQTERLAQTSVNGRSAIWIEEPHYFRMEDGGFRPWQFVPGAVLIWMEDGLTYRLEGAPSLGEAVRIAESLEAQERER